MKNKSAMYSLICAMGLGYCGIAHAQSSIAYFNGPAFGFTSWDEAGAPLDLDKDGVPDFAFVGGPGLTTGDPNSGYIPYSVTALGTNGFLIANGRMGVVAAGTLIGGVAASNTAWTNAQSATLVAFGFNGGGQVIFSSSGTITNPATEGWGGPVTPPGGAFLGVRFYSADGLHYGWIRAQLPAPITLTNNIGTLEGPPVILDWAYETRPNASIIAGATPISVPLAAPKIVETEAIQLIWPSQTNLAYQVQYKDQLDAPFWTNFGGPMIATSTNTTLDLPIVNAARFYRVVLAQ